MIYVEFDKPKYQSLEATSMYIKFVYNSPTFEEDLAKIKTLCNRTYDKASKTWEVPYNKKFYNELKELYGNEIRVVNPEKKPISVKDMVDQFLETYDWGKYKPYKYQLEGVRYGLNKRNWILGDTMGLGKSYQTIHIANILKQRGRIKHCLVICCINSLKYNWKNEIEKFTDNSAIILGTRYGKTSKTKDRLYDLSVEETKKQIEECPEEFFWIINIEKLRATEKEEEKHNTVVDALNVLINNGELGLVIIDEIHMCRNPQAQQSRMLMNISDNARKIGMSGTLLVNNPLNLYVPMKTIGLITSNYYVYQNKYILKDFWGGVAGFQNVEELQETLHMSFLRRLKEDVAQDLPPVVIKNEILEMSQDEQRVFDELTGKLQKMTLGQLTDFGELLDKLENKAVDKIDMPTTIMSVITRLRQCTTHTGLLSTKIQKSTKFERLKNILDEAKFNNEKVLVFCQFTQAIDIAREYFKEYNPKIAVGGMGERLMQTVEEHENTEGFSVIFAQTQALGVGYSLPNTTQVVFLTILWDYATFEQCFNRCHRITSTKSVTVTNLIMKDTYDEEIYNKIYAKKAMGDIIVDKGELEECIDYIKRLGIEFRMDDGVDGTLLG